MKYSTGAAVNQGLHLGGMNVQTTHKFCILPAKLLFGGAQRSAVVGHMNAG